MRATPRRARRPLVGVLTFLATLVVGATVAQAAPLLPDLDPGAPGRPRPAAGADGRIYLTFNATFDNVGAGPLVLRGHRGSTAEPSMIADQVIEQDDGAETTVPAVGGLVYDTEYRRWGFSPYIGFELRATDGSLLGTGPDLGFCVMDTKNTNKRVALPGEPPSKVYTDRSCGRSNPSLLAAEVGISVGWGNLHTAGKKGQMIDITALPTGRVPARSSRQRVRAPHRGEHGEQRVVGPRRDHVGRGSAVAVGPDGPELRELGDVLVEVGRLRVLP